MLDHASGRREELISGVPLFLCISHTKRNRGEAFGRFGYDTRYSGRMFGPETVRSTKYGRYIIFVLLCLVVRAFPTHLGVYRGPNMPIVAVLKTRNESPNDPSSVTKETMLFFFFLRYPLIGSFYTFMVG